MVSYIKNHSDLFCGISSGISQTIFGHPFDTIKVNLQSNKKIKINNLYNGLKYPLISNSLLVGLQFELYYKFNAITAGFLTSFIIIPFDYYKINLQNNNKFSNLNYFLRNSVKVFPVTFLRESIALYFYFHSYEYLHKEKKYNPLLSGGIAGASSWLTTYHLDTIKSRMQNGLSFNESIKLENFWKGINITLIRGLIINGIGFYIAEKTSKIINLL